MCLKYLCEKCKIRQSYVLCVMAFLALVSNYTMRNCLSIALTEMVSPHPDQEGESTECPKLSKQFPQEASLYEWTPQQIASVLSSFFPGYVISHLPGGFLATKYGGKHVLGFGVIASAGLCAITPVAVDFGGYKLLCGIRFAMGLAQGPLFPAIHTLLSRWVLIRQRGKLASMVVAGSHIGTIVCNIFSAYIISATKNWTLVFYFWSFTGTIWYVLFMVLCSSDPSQNRYIGEEEKEELLEECGVTTKQPIPWKMIICYKPVIALMVAEAGHGVLLFFVVVNLPKYFKDVLKYNVVEIGVMTSLPNIGVWVCSAVLGIIADWLIINDHAQVLTIRKIYATIGCITPSFFFVMAGYSGCHRTVASAMFVIAMCFKGFFYPGVKVNPLDITKHFTGIVSALTNAIGSLAYYPLSHIIAAVAKQNLIEQWLIVFWLMFTFNFFSIILFHFWASAERAPWDMDETDV